MQLYSLIKLLRIQRFKRVSARARKRAQGEGRHPQNIVVKKMSIIVRLLLAFILWSHFCGCLYWFIGRVELMCSSPSWISKFIINRPELETARCIEIENPVKHSNSQ